MHRTGTVSVQRDVKLVDVYGAEHQIDVIVTHKQGLHEHKTIIECKYWHAKIKRVHVDAMAHTMRSLGVSKGAFFSTKGYQSGAKKVAEKVGIGIFTVRELAPSEWGSPRVLDFWLQYVFRAFGPLKFEGLALVSPRQAPPGKLSLDLCVGPEDPTSTPVLNASGTPQEDTLENLLERASKKVMSQLPQGHVRGDGDRRIAYVRAPISVPFDPPLQIKVGDAWIMCPRLEVELGFKIEQVRFVYDRANAFVYALAVEDCVNGESYALGRRRKPDRLEMHPMGPPPEPLKGKAIENGCIIRVSTILPFDFSELEALPHRHVGGTLDRCREP